MLTSGLVLVGWVFHTWLLLPSGSEQSVVAVVGNASEVLPCVVPGGSGRMCFWVLGVDIGLGWGS